MSRDKRTIIDAMCDYAQRKPVRMHMPGHKGKRVFSCGSDAVPTAEWANSVLDDLRAIDMTESPGLDNLHYPTGCIRETQRRAEKLYDSARTFMLVNGATSGIQASLLAARMTLGDGRIVLPRNVHKSVVSAMAMSGLEPVYVCPQYHEGFGGYFPLDIDRIKGVLEKEAFKNSDCPLRAVLILNPTYSGFSRDLTQIADLVHSYGAILIVDEAHGSHFGLSRDVPVSAIKSGADLVVHGCHKTTVAFTQTAFLHVGKETPARFPALAASVEEALRAVQTTSPSYILLASLEQAVTSLEKDAGKWVDMGVKTAKEVSHRLSQIPGISVAGYDPNLPIPQGLSHDPGRILVNVGGLGITGPEACNYLITRKNVDPEMVGPDFLLLIWTGADDEHSVDAVEGAFKDLAIAVKTGDIPSCTEGVTPVVLGEAPIPKKAMPLREAFLSVFEPVPIEEALGRVSADTIVIYPPGSPLVTPGEVIDENVIQYILRAKKFGLNVLGRGVDDGKKPVEVYCVRSANDDTSYCMASS